MEESSVKYSSLQCHTLTHFHTRKLSQSVFMTQGEQGVVVCLGKSKLLICFMDKNDPRTIIKHLFAFTVSLSPWRIVRLIHLWIHFVYSFFTGLVLNNICGERVWALELIKGCENDHLLEPDDRVVPAETPVSKLKPQKWPMREKRCLICVWPGQKVKLDNWRWPNKDPHENLNCTWREMICFLSIFNPKLPATNVL